MLSTILIAFLVLFVLVLLSATLGLKFFDSQRKRQVTAMLQTVSGDATPQVSNLLIEPEDLAGGPIQRLLGKFNFVTKVQEQLQQAGMNWTPGKLFSVMGGMAVCGALIGLRFGLLGDATITSITLAAVFGATPFLLVRRKRTKRMAAFESQFPEALEFLSRSMRAGHAFTISLEMLGEELSEPLGQEFRTLFNEQNLGAPLEMALRNMTLRVPLLDVRFFASSVMLQKQTGGNLSEILTRLSEVIRERFRLKGAVKAASAHGRLTAMILMALPIVTGLALLVVAPGYLQGMAEDSDGKWLIGGSVAAQFLGNYCIRRIINIKV
jgi:tight adherence protein B